MYHTRLKLQTKQTKQAKKNPVIKIKASTFFFSFFLMCTNHLGNSFSCPLISQLNYYCLLSILRTFKKMASHGRVDNTSGWLLKTHSSPPPLPAPLPKISSSKEVAMSSMRAGPTPPGRNPYWTKPVVVIPLSRPGSWNEHAIQF